MSLDNPTVDEQAWMRLIGELTCGACWRLFKPEDQNPCEERHHLLQSGLRVGHGATIPTCRYHHQGAGGPPQRWLQRHKFSELDVLADTIVRAMQLIRQGVRP